MNDGAFAAYDNFFSGGGTFQQSEFDVQITEHHDMLPAGGLYYNAITLPDQHAQLFSMPSPPSAVTQLQQQLINTTPIHGGSLPSSLTKSALNGLETVHTPLNTVCSVGVSGAGVAYANIPFVQIHTTDVQPQLSSFGNVFRRSASKQDEIKSEPIKSESTDATKDRTNATPTPPARTASSSSSGAVGEKNISSQSGNSADASKNVLMATPADVTNAVHVLTSSSCVHKCSQCPFISLSPTGVASHSASVHPKSGEDLFMHDTSALRFRIPCPGCENIFYAQTSLEMHLREDHLMTFEDLNQLMDEVKKKYPCSEQHQRNESRKTSTRETLSSSTQQQQQHQQDTHRKSRIYLKNVECLREPRREPIEQQQNQITEQFFQMNTYENDCNGLMDDVRDANHAFTEILGDVNNGDLITNHNHIMDTVSNTNSNNNNNNININNHDHNHQPTSTKQKISIKSVDVLREPALLRRDYELQGFNNFMNECGDIDLHALNNNISSNNNVTTSICEQFSYASCTPNVSSSMSSNTEVNNNTSNNGDCDFQKPRRPKIYIKNVDILKEPMILTDNLNIQEPLNHLLSDSMNFGFMTQNNGVESVAGGGTVTGGASNFLNGSENSSIPPVGQEFDASLSPQMVVPMIVGNISEQYLFESAVGSNNNNNNNSSNTFLPTASGAENFSFVNNNNGQMSNCFMLDNNRFDYIGGDLAALHTSSTPIITEPTPPPQPIALTMHNETEINHRPLDATVQIITPHPQQKQKIFIKNVDILKEPQFQEQQRGTLHLRTVDELNLMNKIEVENLIAPNLDNTQSSGNCQQTPEEQEETNDEDEEDEALNLNDSHFTHLSEQHTKLSLTEDDAFYANDSSFKLQDFDAAQVVNNWADDYDLGDDIDCIITGTVSSPMNAISEAMVNTNAVSKTMTMTTVHDLDTPQMSLISIRDIEELTGGGGGAGGSIQHQHTNQLNLFQQQDIVLASLDSAEMITPTVVEVPPVSYSETTKTPLAQHDVDADFSSVSGLQKETGCRSSAQIFELGLKQELRNTATTATTSASPMTTPTITHCIEQQTDVLTPANLNSIPPLVPVSITISVSSPPPTQLTTFEMTSSAPPPLMAVTSSAVITTTASKDNNTAAPVKVPNIPMPPLVPVGFSAIASPQHNSSSANVLARTNASPTTHPAAVSLQTSPPVERGRIYVASNLMETSTTSPTSTNSTAELDKKSALKPITSLSATVAVSGGTSVRGRPFGSNRTGITKIRKLYGNATDIEVGIKCTVQACAFRFKKPETLEYHKRCHKSKSTSPQSMLCPECLSTGFNNWNTLHTHLWRSHQVDMELYSCELCAFKTPVYSRLINTHSKIHSEDRNYKCNLCDKAFKNTKQLKNHRRWHRNHTATGTAITLPSSTADAAPAPASLPASLKLHHCNDCGAVFSHPKTLRSHICKTADTQVQCEICGRVVASKSSLKLHLLTHETAKRYKCSLCEYEANDHNAFRRHKMTHDNKKMYVCPYCSYKSIQSAAFQKHVQQKHPDVADSIIHKCSLCPFSTINQSLFAVHQAKHETASNDQQQLQQQQRQRQHECSIESFTFSTTNEGGVCPTGNQTEITLNAVVHAQELLQPSKIKVKSNLLITDPNKFSGSGVCAIV